MMRVRGLAAAMLPALMAATPASATVTYSLVDARAAFSFDMADFVTTATRASTTGQGSCAISTQVGRCTYVDLMPFTSPVGGLRDEVDIGAVITGPAGGYQTILRYYVPVGALSAAGTRALAGGGTLTVSSSAVPEPASWAMLVAGLGVAGVALRRRRAPNRTAIAG